MLRTRLVKFFAFVLALGVLVILYLGYEAEISSSDLTLYVVAGQAMGALALVWVTAESVEHAAQEAELTRLSLALSATEPHREAVQQLHKAQSALLQVRERPHKYLAKYDAEKHPGRWTGNLLLEKDKIEAIRSCARHLGGYTAKVLHEAADEATHLEEQREQAESGGLNEDAHHHLHTELNSSVERFDEALAHLERMLGRLEDHGLLRRLEQLEGLDGVADGQ